MRKYVVVGIMMAMGFVCLSPMAMSMAEDGMGQGMQMKHQRIAEACDVDEAALGLTQEQRAQMQALRTQMQEKMKALRAGIKAKRAVFFQELSGAGANRLRAEAIVTEISDLEREMLNQQVDRAFRLRDILTPEQYQKMHEMHKMKKSGKGKHHGESIKGMKKKMGKKAEQD